MVLRLVSVDSQTRAQVEIDAAEQSVKHIDALVRRMEDRDEVIGTVIDVVDGIIDVVDDIAEVSWFLYDPKLSHVYLL